MREIPPSHIERAARLEIDALLAGYDHRIRDGLTIAPGYSDRRGVYAVMSKVYIARLGEEPAFLVYVAECKPGRTDRRCPYTHWLGLGKAVADMDLLSPLDGGAPLEIVE